MCSFCDEAGDDNNGTWRLDRQPRLICIDKLKVDAHWLDLASQEKLYWGRRKFFFNLVCHLFRMQRTSLVRYVSSQFRTINAHFIIIRGNLGRLKRRGRSLERS